MCYWLVVFLSLAWAGDTGLLGAPDDAPPPPPMSTSEAVRFSFTHRSPAIASTPLAGFAVDLDGSGTATSVSWQDLLAARPAIRHAGGVTQYALEKADPTRLTSGAEVQHWAGHSLSGDLRVRLHAKDGVILGYWETPAGTFRVGGHVGDALTLVRADAQPLSCGARAVLPSSRSTTSPSTGGIRADAEQATLVQTAGLSSVPDAPIIDVGFVYESGTNCAVPGGVIACQISAGLYVFPASYCTTDKYVWCDGEQAIAAFHDGADPELYAVTMLGEMQGALDFSGADVKLRFAGVRPISRDFPVQRETVFSQLASGSGGLYTDVSAARDDMSADIVVVVTAPPALGTFTLNGIAPIPQDPSDPGNVDSGWFPIVASDLLGFGVSHEFGHTLGLRDRSTTPDASPFHENYMTRSDLRRRSVA